MKRSIYCAIATLALAFTVGCTSGGEVESNVQPSASEPSTEALGESVPESDKKVTVWAWDPNFNVDIMQNAEARYEANNENVDIDVIEMAKGDLEQLLHTNLAAGVSDALPDIVLIEDYNAQKYLQTYKGAFADLTSSFNYDDFTDYKVEFMKLDNGVYGVPFDSGVSAFFYRTDILEEAGYTATDLENITWDDFITIGTDVKEKTGKKLLTFGKDDGGIIRIILQSAGSWYFDNEGNIAMSDNKALIEALDTYKKIVDSDIIIPTSGWTEWVSGFNSGDASSVTTGAWIIGSIKAAEDQSGLWGVAPIPHLTTTTSGQSNLGGSSWYVLNTDNTEEAIKFLQETYGSDVEFYQDILVNNGAIGSYLPAFGGDAYTVSDEFFGGQQIYLDLTSYMEEIPAVNYGLYTYEADGAIMSLIEELYAGRMTAEELVKTAEDMLKIQIN